MRLRNEFGNGDADEDEDGSGGGAEAEPFAHDKEGRDPCKNRFESQQERGVGGGQDRLSPALDGECCGSGKCGGDEESGDKARREVDVRMFDEGETDGHKQRAKTDLQDGKWLKGNARRDMAESNAVEGKSDGAAESENVSEIDRRDIRQK